MTREYRSITRENQPAATYEAAVALAERQKNLASGPPRPGDVFLLRRTADFPVEWLVAEVAGSFARVVLVDDHPFVGSHDLELPSELLGGAGVLRGDLGRWIDAADLEPELRTGTLPPAEVELVRGKLDAIGRGDVQPSLLEEEVDGDPEYRRWCDGTLAAAVETLAGVPAPPLPPPVPVPIATGRVLRQLQAVGFELSEWIVQARLWAGNRGKQPQAGDQAVQRALDSYVHGNSPSPQEFPGWFRREVWRGIGMSH